MKRLALSFLVFAATVASTRPAFADPVSSFYNFAYIGEGITGDYPDQTPVFIDITGEMTVDPSPVAPVPETGTQSGRAEVTSTTPPAYQVVYANFTFEGNLFGLVPNPYPGYFTGFLAVPGETTCCGLLYDDLLYPELGDGNYLDPFGLLFTDGNGDVIELGGGEGLGNDYFQEYTLQGDTEAQGAFIIAAPEPSSWLLVGTGLLCLVALLFANREANLHSKSS